MHNPFHTFPFIVNGLKYSKKFVEKKTWGEYIFEDSDMKHEEWM